MILNVALLTPEQLIADAEQNPVIPTNQEMGQVAEYAKQMRQLAAEITDLEEKLAEKQKLYDDIETDKLPDVLKQIGLPYFRLDDGTTVEVKKEYYGSISADNQSAASAWLREQNCADIIKNEIKLAFGMGEDVEVKKLVDRLTKAGYTFEQKESVHASTLKAFIKEQTEAGVTLPECFNVCIKDRAKLVAPKKKKGK